MENEKKQSLEENESYQINKQQKLLEFSEFALTTLNEQEFFDRICKEMTLITDCNLTGIYKYEIKTNQFNLVSFYVQNINDTLSTVRNEPNTIAGYTFLKDRPVFYEDIKNDSKFSDSPLLKLFNVISGFSCTIKNSYRKWGVFGSLSVEANKITKKDSEFFFEVGHIIGLFLEKKENFQNFLNNYALETAVRLTSGITHDFNNYLSIIDNNLKLFKESMLDDFGITNSEKNHLIERSLLTIEKSKDLIRQLQLFGQNKDPMYSELDINKIIIGMKEIFNHKRLSTDQNEININYQLSDELLKIKGDPSQINQILLNLVTNAIEASNKEPGIIEIKTELLVSTNPKNLFIIAYLGLTPTNYVHLTVSDNGIGMSQELIENIFSPYARGEKTFSTTGHNYGLGMSIVYNIVKKMNGEIKIFSNIDKGTQFDIYFPCID